MNLLQETLEVLQNHGKTPQQVKWVGNDQGKTTWAVFEKVAKRVDYNNGYGGNEIPLNLLVVGGTWWLERSEYDGLEWWAFRQQPEEPGETIDNIKVYIFQED